MQCAAPRARSAGSGDRGNGAAVPAGFPEGPRGSAAAVNPGSALSLAAEALWEFNSARCS